MEKQVIEQIKAIARHLSKSNEYLTRSELAYNLQEFGVEHDSNKLSQVICELMSDPDTSIRNGLKHILTNDRTQPLTEQWKRYQDADNNDTDSLKKQSITNLKHTKKTLKLLEQLITSEVVTNNTNSLLSKTLKHLTGSAGIDKIKQESEATMAHYAGVVDAYQKARISVINSVEDFVAFRDILLENFLYYSQALIDAFGEQIKSEAPDLFDVSTIEYLDPEQMFTEIQLQFNKLNEKCGDLMGLLGKQFIGSLESGVKQGSLTSDNRVKVALLGFEVIKHYINSANQTEILRSEFSQLQTLASKDLSQIRADIKRLEFIYNTLNKLLIPKLDIFQRFSKIILSEELCSLVENLYSNKEVYILQKQRESLQKELKELHRQLQDCDKNIRYLRSRAEDTQGLINDLSSRCEEAQKALPKKPSIAKVIVSIGQAKKKYNKAAAEWKRTCYPFIVEYESLKAEQLSDEEELLAQHTLKNNVTKQIKITECKCEAISAEIRTSISVDNKLKSRLYPHCKSLIELLRSAKEILSARIDQKYLKTVQIKDLPKKNIAQMSDEEILIQVLGVAKDKFQISEYIAEESTSLLSNIVELNGDSKIEEKKLQLIVNQQSEIIEMGLQLAQQMATLRKQREQEEINQAFYLEQLACLQKDFQHELSSVEQQTKAMQNIIQRVREAEDSSSLQQALTILVGKEGNTLSETDWEAFLIGGKTIEI